MRTCDECGESPAYVAWFGQGEKDRPVPSAAAPYTGRVPMNLCVEHHPELDSEPPINDYPTHEPSHEFYPPHPPSDDDTPICGRRQSTDGKRCTITVNRPWQPCGLHDGDFPFHKPLVGPRRPREELLKAAFGADVVIDDGVIRTQAELEADGSGGDDE